MLGTVHLPGHIAGAVLIVLLPGPNPLYVLSMATHRVPRGERRVHGDSHSFGPGDEPRPGVTGETGGRYAGRSSSPAAAGKREARAWCVHGCRWRRIGWVWRC